MAMAASQHLFILLCFFIFSSSISMAVDSPLSPPLGIGFLDSLRSQCPLWIEPSSVVEVSGDALDRELSRGQGNVNRSVLFYASWCPFSRNIRPIFDALSSMFPQISHFAVEESSAMPRCEDDNVFSRYGVHRFPYILLGNRTTMVPYRGSKDLSSLVHFYKETTGLDPVAYLDVNQATCSGNSARALRPWVGSPSEMAAKEPYMAFAILFICLKVLVQLFPEIVSRVKALWVFHAWHLNMGNFRESSQLLERALHAVDVKKLWDKLRRCNKARNFRNGAMNARVWASSLASVSLGESSPSRSAHSSL